MHKCDYSYKADRDVTAAQVVVQRGLAAVGHTVVKLRGGAGKGSPNDARILYL